MQSHFFFLYLHSVTDIIQLIIPILKCRTEGFTSFPSIFCFNPSPPRGPPVLAQKWHGFSIRKKIVCVLFIKESCKTSCHYFNFLFNLKWKYNYSLEERKFSVEHPFKKQIQWFLKYIFDSVTSFFLSFSIY